MNRILLLYLTFYITPVDLYDALSYHTQYEPTWQLGHIFICGSIFHLRTPVRYCLQQIHLYYSMVS